jgi:predicted ATPase
MVENGAEKAGIVQALAQRSGLQAAGGHESEQPIFVGGEPSEHIDRETFARAITMIKFAFHQRVAV